MSSVHLCVLVFSGPGHFFLFDCGGTLMALLYGVFQVSAAFPPPQLTSLNLDGMLASHHWSTQGHDLHCGDTSLVWWLTIEPDDGSIDRPIDRSID